ncbi:MAG: VanZ family protein [Haliea sp.]
MPRLRYRIFSALALSGTMLALLLTGEQLAVLTSWLSWPESATVAGYSHADKLMHAGMFAVCGYFMVLGWLTRNLQILPFFLGLLALGGSTEWLQGAIPGRSADVWDVVADAAGAAAGVALGLYLLRRHASPG